MERPSGPLGTATQSSRPAGEKGAPRPAPLLQVEQRKPAPSESSETDESPPPPMSDIQAVALAQRAMKAAIKLHEKTLDRAAVEAGMIVPGITIDLGYRGITRMSEEIVNIINHKLERLALGHNYIKTLPPSFAQLTLLRYLNIRKNNISVFPESIYGLKSLEILDIGRNELTAIPGRIAEMTSLKVLSVQENKIETVPYSISEMPNLQLIKLDANPLKNIPLNLLEYDNAGASDKSRTSDEKEEARKPNEKEDRKVTIRVKEFMQAELVKLRAEAVSSGTIKKHSKQKVSSARSETEPSGDESSEGTETPRPVNRRQSGRFPVRVNGTEVHDLRSPAFAPRPPPIPSRSHYRGLSQQNSGPKRPGILPLSIGNANERLRSNSETLLAAAREPKDRNAERSRRMGIVSKRAQELGIVDETKANNRYSHYRGLSHGSAMGVGTNGITRSPASPADSVLQRPTWVKRLSSLPERKRDSLSSDPIVEGAKSILFALYQVHPLIQNLLGVARDGDKRSSLEAVFYNAITHVSALDKQIQTYESYSEEDKEFSPRSNENVHHTCLTCVGAYMHVCGQIQSNAAVLVDNGDPRYIRHFLLNAYGTIAEIRNASEAFIKARQDTSSNNEGPRPGNNKIQFEAMSQAPEKAESGREATEERDQTLGKKENMIRILPPPGANDGRMRREESMTSSMNEQSLRLVTPRPNPTFTDDLQSSLANATPRSGAYGTRSIEGAQGDSSLPNPEEPIDEDTVFENIYMMLRTNIDDALKLVPVLRARFVIALEPNSQHLHSSMNDDMWRMFINLCDTALNSANLLRERMSQIRLKDVSDRNTHFWNLCCTFIAHMVDIIQKVKDHGHLVDALVLSNTRHLQKTFRVTARVIRTSPWGPHAKKRSKPVLSPASQIPLPMTPQSAALGPAVQATVPSTPYSASFGSSYSNGYDRANTFASSDSYGSSRAGTMTATSAFSRENDDSLSSASSFSNDDYPSNLRVQNNRGNLPYTTNGSRNGTMTDGVYPPQTIISPATPSNPNNSFSRSYYSKPSGGGSTNGNGIYGGVTSNMYGSKPNP